MKKKYILIATITSSFFFSQELKENDSIKDNSSKILLEEQTKIIEKEQPISVENKNPEPTFKNNLGEMKIKFDDEGNKFLRFGLISQIWMRSIENNPGTMVNDVPQDNTYDASIRRMLISMNAQLSNAFSIYIQVGLINQSFISGGGSGTNANGYGKKPKFVFIDAYNELAIIPRKNLRTNKPNKNHLYIGAGLHNWSGISRMSNGSSGKLLAADLPLFNAPNLEISDQFGRQIGLFAHGEYRSFNYRFAVGKPFATDLEPKIGEIVYNNKPGKLSFEGYGMYQFFDKETTSTFALSGNYLGSKKIFNLGLGFYSNNDATLSQPEQDVYRYHNEFIFGADAFLDMPIGKKSKEMSLTLYSVFYKYNYGPNYLRNVAVLNPGVKNPDFKGQTAIEGFGNGRILMGTGNIWFSQAGFVLPKFSNIMKVQPFVSYAMKNLEALNQTGNYIDIGANLFLYSQNAKLTYQYSTRPLYDTNTKTVFTRKGEHLITLQLTF